MKYPVEETVQTWADFDILGKIKYLLDENAERRIHIKQLERKLEAHLSAHQALMEAREAGK